jgi:ribosomal protein S7
MGIKLSVVNNGKLLALIDALLEIGPSVDTTSVVMGVATLVQEIAILRRENDELRRELQEGKPDGEAGDFKPVTA